MGQIYKPLRTFAFLSLLATCTNLQAQTTYCSPTWSGWAVNEPTEPITLVQFGTGTGSINNSSTDVVSALTPRYEDYSSISMDVEQGKTYTLKVKGNTDGNNTNYITVYFDWDGDGTFSNITPPDAASQQSYEKHQHLAALVNSTGTDNLEVTHSVTIPQNAALGAIRMRVVKNYNAPSNHPCTNPFIFGQVEDYTLNVVVAGGNPSNPCAAVQTLSETFDSFSTFPENCWNGNFPSSPNTLIKGTTDKTLQLYSGNLTADLIIVSPELSTIDGQHALSFDIPSIQNAAGATLQVGTMTDNADFSTFSAVEPAFIPVAGTTHYTAKIAANKGHKYIAIKFIHGGGHKVINIDNIEWNTTLGTPSFNTALVKIYPNPSTGIIYIDSELSVAQVEVYNTLGQLILKTDRKQLNLQYAAEGMYVVKVITNTGAQASYKVIKK